MPTYRKVTGFRKTPPPRKFNFFSEEDSIKWNSKPFNKPRFAVIPNLWSVTPLDESGWFHLDYLDSPAHLFALSGFAPIEYVMDVYLRQQWSGGLISTYSPLTISDLIEINKICYILIYQCARYVQKLKPKKTYHEN